MVRSLPGSHLSDLPVTFADVNAAATRIRPFIRRTPVLNCQIVDDLFGAEIFLKCENLQRGRSFKCRGAHNKLLALEDGIPAAIVAHSSGNHAIAVSLAAKSLGCQAFVVMPTNAPDVKVEAVERLGGHVTRCEPTMAARVASATQLVQETGGVFVHPHDDPEVIAGQGTAAVEFIGQAPALDIVMAPVGGGGLISGTAVAFHHLCPNSRIVASEPVEADDAFRSWQCGRHVSEPPSQTVADGLRAPLGELGFEIIRALVHDFVTVSEGAILEALRLMESRARITMEPSSAVPLAALLEKKIDAGDARIGVIVSGGNVDRGLLRSNANG